MFYFGVLCYGASARALLTVAQVFLGKVQKFHCEGKTEDEDPCGTSCEQYVFDKSNFTSIVSEWDLVCQDKEYAGLVQSIFMFGILLGNFFIGPLADQYGRRVVIIYAHIGMALFHLATAYSQNYFQFVTARVFVGFLAAGCITTSPVYTMENAPSTWRTTLNIIDGSCYGLGIALLALLAYHFPAWRDLVFYSNFFLLLFICLLWFVPKSPRWLASQGRLAEAENILMDIAHNNGVTVTYDMVSLRGITPETKQKQRVQTGNVLDSFRTTEMRRRMLILMCTWMSLVMCYFGLTIGSSNLGGNMYITVALSGFVELPSKLIGGILNSRFGRRFGFSTCMILAGLCCLTVGLSSTMSDGEMSSIQTTVAMVGKMAIASAFSTIFVYTGELLPTVIRSSAFSLCSMSGRLAGIIGPLIASTWGDNSSFLTYGSTCLISGILSLSLPETLNQPLPDTVEDVENQALKSSRKTKIKDT